MTNKQKFSPDSTRRMSLQLLKIEGMLAQVILQKSKGKKKVVDPSMQNKSPYLPNKK
jgi:hypothetical protein